MEYLTRPVFQFVPDWSRQPRQTFEYDLRDLEIGFGWPRFTPTQSHVARGFETSIWLQDEEAIVGWDTFFDELRGPLNGFWIQDPQTHRIVDGVSATQFDVADQELRNTWTLDPAPHLYFTKEGEDPPQAAEITAVVLSGSNERITVTPALAVAVDETWTVQRLHYVRLAGDEEGGQVDAEGRVTMQLKVLELPTEYENLETGRQPTYLYHLFASFGGTVVHWRFTSYWDDIESGAETWTKMAITHGALNRSTKADKETATLEALHEGGNPLSLFVPFTLAVPLFVEIYEAPFADPDDVTLLFAGQVQTVTLQHKRIRAKCSSLLDALDRKLPGHILAPRCSYHTYEAGTCKLLRADFEEAADIQAITGPLVRVNNLGTDLATDYFSGGWIETGTGEDFEIRTVLMDVRIDADTHDLTLNLPLNHAILTQAVVILPGDDHRAATCEVKFGNFANFGGHPFIPQNNLTLQAIQASPDAGGKK